MYEILLMLNILWELALDHAALLIAALGIWAVLLLFALRRGAGAWRAALPGALLAGAVVAILAFFTVPAATLSSLSELRYWVDWANLVGIAGGVGAVGVAFAWPLLALRGPGRVGALGGTRAAAH
jgi:hypothetical protein